MKQLVILCGIVWISTSCPNAFCSEINLNNKLCVLGDNLDTAEKSAINSQFVEAASIYQCYLLKHPKEKQVYIDHVDSLRAFENYNEAISVLNNYQKLFGTDYDFQRSKARVFADAGFYDSALKLNDPLIKRSPNDSYLMATQASALYQSGKKTEGLTELNELIRKHPESDDIDYLKILIAQPLQSSLSVGSRFQDLTQATDPMYVPPSGQYIHQNDSVSIYRVPILMQHYFNPTTSLLFSALGETLTARPGSDLTTAGKEPNTDEDIDEDIPEQPGFNVGKSRISDQEYLIGLDSFVTPRVELQGLVGGVAISNGLKRPAVYLASKVSPNEDWKISVGALHDLYRPIDLTNGSPRSVSLAIMETGGRFHTNYKPSLESTIDLDLRVSHLSDSNSYARLDFEPGLIVFNTNRTNLMLGLNAEWLTFNKDLSEDGYYAPSLFQLYEIIGLYNINVTPTFYIELYAGGGVSKDNSSHLGPAGDVGIETKYTIYKNIDLSGEVDYLGRTIKPFYSEFRGSVSLTLRFA